MKRLFIPAAIIEDMLSHARVVYPEEACGLLAGSNNKVQRIFRISNAEHSAYTYRMDEKEQFHAFKEIKSEGLSLLAIYHSHPQSPAYPSGTDISRAFFPNTSEPNYPDAAYIIIGPLDNKPKINAFHIEKDKITNVEISVI